MHREQCVASRAILSQLSSLVRHQYVWGMSPEIIPATGCDSEAVRFLKGTFKVRTSKASSFFNLLSSASACAENSGRFPGGRPYCCALKKLNGTRDSRRSAVRSSAARRCAGSSRSRPPTAFPDVENRCKICAMCGLTGFFAARYVCKVSRTTGLIV